MKVPVPERMSSGNWFIRMRLGGQNVNVTATGKTECIKKAELIKAEYRTGKRKVKKTSLDKSLTVRDAIDNYITKRSNTISPLTIRGYRIIQKNRFESIMDRPVVDLKKEEWQGIVNREAGLCAPKTLKNAWGFLRSVIKECTGEFPPEVTLPTEIPNETEFLDPEQIEVFVSAVKDTQYAVPALLALSSLRASEIEALKWEDIPKNPKYIKVSGAVVLNENNKRVNKKSNKNVQSARNVPIMIPELSAALERCRKDKGPVMPFRQNSLRYGIEKICRENGLPDVGIHGLRHSFASLAYHLQIPEKIAMEMGGWSDPGTMHKIYTHIAKSDMTRYQTAMTDFYAKDKKDDKKIRMKGKLKAFRPQKTAGGNIENAN